MSDKKESTVANAKRYSLLILAIGGALLLLIGAMVEHGSPMAMGDFRALHVGARCLLHHCDPYSPAAIGSFFNDEGPPVLRQLVTVYVNLPTTFLFTLPLGLMPWAAASLIWQALTVGSFFVAAYLTWRVAAEWAPLLSAWIIAFLIANSEVLMGAGNTAGLVVSFCVIAAWCFIFDRFARVGVVLLAVSLLMKPHDSGLVWLYFLLAGGMWRKRALQTLAVAVVLGLPMIAWVGHVAPNWLQEWQANLASLSARGGFNDPGPTSHVARNAGDLIDLRTVISVFRDDPRIYNPIAYVIGGGLLAVWVFCVLRLPRTRRSAFVALAAVSVLTMLITYHKPIDARLLLVAIPAGAALWVEGSKVGKSALIATAVAVVLIADLPSALRSVHAYSMQFSDNLGGKILSILVTRPTPIVLLVMAGCFLWVLAREEGQARAGDGSECTSQ